jgi:hypothetical protein
MARHDIIAQIYYARRLAKKLQPFARLVDLHGGHLVSHERTEEVFLLSYIETWHDSTIALWNGVCSAIKNYCYFRVTNAYMNIDREIFGETGNIITLHLIKNNSRCICCCVEGCGKSMIQSRNA